MKRNSIVPVCCALLFANILVAANAKDIEGLIGKCSNGDQKACRELKAAVPKLTDQALLAKIAVESRDPAVRRDAVEKLTDQELLAKIAVSVEDPVVRGAAIEKLTDQELLAKIAVEDMDPVIRTKAIVAMNESNPALKRLAGLGGPPLLGRACRGDSCTTGDSIARIKLAIQEPRIRSRLPGIVFAASVSAESRSYSGAGGSVIASGESVSVVLSQAGKTLVEKHWSSLFTTFSEFPGEFWPAGVHGDDLLADLLHSAVFSQDDLAKLSSSEIWDVRAAAVRNLTDQALLAKIAVEDKVPGVRQAAVEKLTDQALLAKIAVEDKSWEVSGAAVSNLTDQALLEKIAVESKEPGVREAVRMRLAQIRNNTK